LGNNKTDRHDITEILLKVALSTINLRNEDGSNKNWMEMGFFSFFSGFFIPLNGVKNPLRLFNCNKSYLSHLTR
jgi:hypothetical protein